MFCVRSELHINEYNEISIIFSHVITAFCLKNFIIATLLDAEFYFFTMLYIHIIPFKGL